MPEGKMEFITPEHPALKDKIKLYYVHASQDPKFEQTIIYYPNFTTTLNIYQNSGLRFSDFSRTHFPESTPEFLQLLVGKFDRSRELKTLGPFNKLTIVFHPLGLNHFIEQPLGHLVKEHFSIFSSFGSAFRQILGQVFATNDLLKKREMLDVFFLEHYKGFEEERLKYAVERIINAEDTIKASDLAEALGINRKTLLRLFQKHLNYSVEEYISVVKFRKALIHFQQNRSKINLTNLAYQQNYYDQSDLNKHFKQKTGLKPSTLFAALETFEKGLFWGIN